MSDEEEDELEDEGEEGEEDEEDEGDEGDDEGYDDEEGGEHEVYFDEETEGVLIAGKAFETGSITRRDLGVFATKVEEIGSQAGIALSVVPGGDLTDTGPSPDDTVYTTVHVGFEGARGGTYGPDMLSVDAVKRAIERAHQVSAEVWSAIGEALPERERSAFNEAEVGLHFTCVGPLAAATLVLGVLGKRDGEGPGEFVYGQDMEQEPHAEGVFGLRVAYVQYESPESEEVDFSDGAHEERVKELGVPDAHYFIVARYD